jgi:hypothetical protein
MTPRQPNLTAQLIAQCRDEPLIFDNVRPDLCADLEQIILQRMKIERRSTASLNIGGWKSPETFFSLPDAAVQELRAVVVAMVGAAPIGWAMVNRHGSSHPRHQHTIARIFGVYYVTAGSEDAITPTVFECAAHGELEVDPHPGRLVIAPGTMWHRVGKYLGALPRITIAFDIRR